MFLDNNKNKNMNNLAEGTQAPQISEQTVKDAKPVICACGNMVFEEKMMFKKISSIVSPTGNYELFPLNLVICTSCGLVPEEFNPRGIIPEEFLAKKYL